MPSINGEAVVTKGDPSTCKLITDVPSREKLDILQHNLAVSGLHAIVYTS